MGFGKTKVGMKRAVKKKTTKKAVKKTVKKAVKKKVCSFMPSAASVFHGSVDNASGATERKATTHGHVLCISRTAVQSCPFTLVFHSFTNSEDAAPPVPPATLPQAAEASAVQL